MISYEDLITGVRDRGGIDTNDSAESVTRAALATITGYLPADRAQRLADVLPRRLQDAVQRHQQADGSDAAALVDDVARRLDVSSERARYHLQAVLSALQESDPALVDSLREWLPGALAQLAGSPVATAEPISSRRLTDEEVEQELRALPTWTGNSRRIRRTVAVPPDRRDMLIDQVRCSADREKERLEVNVAEGQLELTVYTASVESVTPDDLAFAARLDEIIDAAPYISR